MIFFWSGYTFKKNSNSVALAFVVVVVAAVVGLRVFFF